MIGIHQIRVLSLEKKVLLKIALKVDVKISQKPQEKS